MSAGAPDARAVRRCLRGEAGSAPAAVLAWIGLAVVLLGMLGVLGQGVRAAAQAASAADLSALAAADALALGNPDPCAIGRETAARNGAQLLDCTVEGDEVVVRAATPAGVLPEATADARAGPGPPPG